ncbi:MAG: hypothetical protein CFE23_01040 [Flavobacterium sp. BFFFF1]|uniref:hypothetical protein n=1 Tax=Flavobacterium sp. BFFFF1 TaxID=2015557 RepID=UPI000BD111A4|nr:hypothetical protein [Flavobacterium sp. BFFFF1]OYU82333.1 MAG: hypothetical protein CFE23_01040 [Flavobacterium sp. BFFFF1]
MKKIILIAAVVLVAIVGLTSFNGKEQHKEKGNASLIAQLDSEPVGGVTTTTGVPPTSGDKKKN